MERPKIGELLVAAGVIEQDVLDTALEKQRAQGGRLGKILLGMGALDEEMLVRTVARQLDMPVAWLRGKQVKAEVLAYLPKHVALRHRCLPVMLDRKGAETLLVAMEDPSDSAALDEVAIAAGRPVRVVLAAPSELDDALARHYPAEPAADPAEEEPELLLTDPLGETGGAEPELRHVERGAAPVEPPAPVDPLDLGGTFDPSARPDETPDLDIDSDLGVSAERPDAGGAADLEPEPDPTHDAPVSPDPGDDLGLDIGPEARPERLGDSLDDAIDEVRGAADAALEDELEGDAELAPADEAPSLFEDDPLEITLPPRPVRTEAPPRDPDVHALPRDPELRAVVLLLIERGLLSGEELSERLLAQRGDGEDAGG